MDPKNFLIVVCVWSLSQISLIMKTKNRCKTTRNLSSSSGGGNKSISSKITPTGPKVRTMLSRRVHCCQSILTKVAILLVLLPHMAQTKYARGKTKKIPFYFLMVSVCLPRCNNTELRLLFKVALLRWRDVCVKTFAQRVTSLTLLFGCSLLVLLLVVVVGTR